MTGLAPMNRRQTLLGAATLAGLAGFGPSWASTPAFSAAGLSRVEADLKRHVAEGRPPGVVALAARGNETRVWSMGAMTLEGAPPVRRDTIFRVASMTKPITAAVAMMLIEEGKLKLGEPIERLAPELANRRVLKRPDGPLDDTVPAKRPITVEDVLSYRLGWGIDFDPNHPFVKAAGGILSFGIVRPGVTITPDAWMQQLAALPLQAQPGERWLYNTAGDLLGVLISRATGKPLDLVFQERILGPLGMKDTGFYVPAAKVSRLTTAFVNQGGKLAVFDPPNGMFSKPPSFPEGAAGLVSTADDYARFAKFMLTGLAPNGRRLLSRGSLMAMTTNRLTPEQMKAGNAILGPGRGWGLGLSVRVAPSPQGAPAGAYGWDGGLGSSWINDPARSLTLIVLTQQMFETPHPPPAVCQDFMRDVYAALARA